MYRLSVLALMLVATACTTTQEAKQRQLKPWIGQTARSFGEQNSLVPVSVYDTPTGGRTFIYQKQYPMGACGVTLGTHSVPGNNEWVIFQMASTCPPGAF